MKLTDYIHDRGLVASHVAKKMGSLDSSSTNTMALRESS